MRLLLVSAGAASMYCGSCMRDNALAAELIRRRHEVTLLPFYTPTLTDEENVSRGSRVFFGGISVYLEQHLALFRHTPRLLDRLWDAPSVIKAFSSGSIAVAPESLGALTVSTLKGEDGRQRKEIDKLLEFVAGEPKPDVINLPYTLLIAIAEPLKRVLGGVPIVMTLQGEDLFLDGLPEPYRRDARALIEAQLPSIDLFVAVSQYYADYMCEYLRIPREKMRVAPLGISMPDTDAAAPLARSPFTVGYFARLAPEKGLHLLAEAYRILRHEKGLPPSRLRAAGYRGPDQQRYYEGILRQLESWELGSEFEYAGAPDRARKFEIMRGFDVMAVPSPYHEPKGIYLLEAMACGVPVVSPNHGAFPEVLRATGGGVLARSSDPADIAEAIFALWQDPSRAAALGESGRQHVRHDYTLAKMAERVEAVYREAVEMRMAGTRR